MHPLLRFTLDLFEPNWAPAPGQQAPTAIEIPRPVVVSANPTSPLIAPVRTLETVSFHHPRANREARLCEVLVAYEFTRGQRRNIGFVVGPDGLVVRAPKWVPLHQVDAALQDKSRWIIKKLGETRERQQRLHERRIEWRDGSTMPYLGQSVRLMLAAPQAGRPRGVELQAAPPGPGEGLALDQSTPVLRVGLPATATPDQVRDTVHRWLKAQAQQRFVQRLDHFAPQLQVQWRRLSLSSARTRWGSASVDGSIRLNWRLMYFQPSVIDYVVAHELSHLRVMDHSARFWATVHSVIPDYASLRRQLKDEALPRGA